MESATDGPCHAPSRLAVAFAFSLIYLSWGTTYLAIRVGVEHFPPALFGGTRIALAGVIMLGFLALRGGSLKLPWGEWGWLLLVSILMFVGGNGLITWGEETVPSGVASVLVATTPLWIGLVELVRPHGERLSLLGWLGLLVGLAGVCLLLVPRLQQVERLSDDLGPFLVLASSISWAIGSVIVRIRRHIMAGMVAVAYQMILGGLLLVAIGWSVNEHKVIAAANFTPAAVYSFFHLLVVGSLIGFVAFNWLLRHVSAAMVGTYAYVNPVVAILVGWALYSEEITSWVLGGMGAVLAGVALVRASMLQPVPTIEEPSEPENAEHHASTLRFYVSSDEGANRGP